MGTLSVAEAYKYLLGYFAGNCSRGFIIDALCLAVFPLYEASSLGYENRAKVHNLMPGINRTLAELPSIEEFTGIIAQLKFELGGE